MAELMPVAEALGKILSAVPTMPAEDVALTEALGRVTAGPVTARRAQPPKAVSAMDGYAVRAEDVTSVPATLKRIGAAPAGHGFEGTVGPGEAVRVFTGAPVPEGADTVVIQEDVTASAEVDGAEIVVRETAAAGAFVRPAGLDFREGDEGIAAGKVLSVRDVGLAAAMNRPWIAVRRKPRVAILSTGDEIVRPGDPIGPDQIVSSNSLALHALVTAFGGTPINLGIAPDTVEGLQTMAAGARGADMIVTTGGASVGEHDLVQSALGKDAFGPDGLDVAFWRIAMRPGKPLIFGSLGGAAMLGLPGNPVSTIVCGAIFLVPALLKMLGVAGNAGVEERLPLAVDIPENDRRQDYVRATVSFDGAGRRVVTPFSKQDSSMMSVLGKSDCLVVRPPHDPPRPAGEDVTVLRFAAGLQGL